MYKDKYLFYFSFHFSNEKKTKTKKIYFICKKNIFVSIFAYVYFHCYICN